MPNKKPDLASQLGQRRQPQPLPEPVKPENPITALSAQLQQQTDQSVAQPAPEPEETHADEDARMHARTHENMPTRIQAGRGTRTQSRKQGEIDVEELYERIRDKKHLANLSFRYQPDELREMDAIYGELEKEKPGRMSKNDMARLALILLCDDYRKHGDTSTLAQVLRRM